MGCILDIGMGGELATYSHEDRAVIRTIEKRNW